jgi:selenocysteine lyase/cysteine desulfurase
MYHDARPAARAVWRGPGGPRRGGPVAAEPTLWTSHFSGFGGAAYLDCAAQGPFPKEAAEAVRLVLGYKERPEGLPEALYEELPARVREAAARLIGCSPASIAIGSGASHGLNVAALGLPLKSGDEVLLAQGEFPANVYPWLNRESDGIRVRFVRPESGPIVDAAAMIREIGPRTRVVSVSLVAFATGYRVDIKALAEACRERGAFFVVDGAQGVGSVDFRVADYPIDVLAVSGYKWLFGPYGTGFAYVSPRVLERLRVCGLNWLAVEGTGATNRLTDYRLKLREGARRFDIPETASFLNLSAFAASIEFLNRVRVPTVEAHARRLLDALIRGIDSTRLRVVSDQTPERRSSILALEGRSLDETHRVFRRLRDKGVIVSLRENLIRVSPNIYNTPDDIVRFIAAARHAPN